ncbi:hypothetical protein [Mucilaginibacter sp. CSA2-8R]|uniref:hypothetical protein n=1 Tax=Mucilaginibacter sp. CSA2-8R TaxID=3141542 RepID=UPI00315D67A0
MNIRFAFLLLFVTTLAAIACKKENKQSDPLTIVGMWKYSSYSGGIAGFKHKAVDAGTNMQLAFGDGGSYRQFDNGATTTQDKFSIIKNYAFTSYYTRDALQLGNKIAGEVSLKRGSQDTLFITPAAGYPDVMTFEYVKLK